MKTLISLSPVPVKKAIYASAEDVFFKIRQSLIHSPAPPFPFPRVLDSLHVAELLQALPVQGLSNCSAFLELLLQRFSVLFHAVLQRSGLGSSHCLTEQLNLHSPDCV